MDYTHLTKQQQVEAIQNRISGLEALHFDLTLNYREYTVAGAPEEEVAALEQQIAQVVARLADMNEFLSEIVGEAEVETGQ